MTVNSYKTIQKISDGLYKEKGSKFISFAIPLSDAQTAKEIVEKYRKEYYDARHVCYAYMLGAEKEEYRTNDDGEPSGTAGKPIIGQINSFELTNILIIVVRYFGGILLGTGGLITAYKEAARDSIINAKIIEKTITCKYKLTFGYNLMSEVMRIFKEFDPIILNSDLQYNCQYEVEIPKARSEEFQHRTEHIYGVKIEKHETQ